jgi:hypothetical protein
MPAIRGQLPKAYLRLDPNVDQTHPDNLDAFVRLLCAANRQPVRGHFRSRAVLVTLFGKAATERLYQRRDVVQELDGSVSVPGWEHWQEGDLTVAERMRRVRGRRNPTVTPPVTPPSPGSNDVTPRVTAQDNKAARQQGNDAVDVSSQGLPKPQAGRARVNGMTHIGAVLPTLREPPTAGTTRLTKQQLDAWSDFGPEWDAFKRAWFGKGLHFPPQGTPHDDDDVSPSPRAMLYGILDARPTDLPRWVAEAPGRTQRDVIGYVLDQWHHLRDSVRSDA